MKASIDIGSNTVLLLVGEVQKGKVIVHHEAQRIPRLAKGVEVNKNLDPESMRRATTALTDYRIFLSEQFPGVEEIYVMATSAVRDANNRTLFIEQVYSETGWTVQLLSGDEEAKLMYNGALSVLNRITDSATVIDIGGGSTEVALGKRDELQDVFSFNMGSVRFTERYLKSDPPANIELMACRKSIKKTLQSRAFELDENTELIGIAGTVTSLAAIVEGMQSFTPDQINDLKITKAELSSTVQRLSTLSSREMASKYPQILEGRADVILAGLLILEEFMNLYNQPNLIVSSGGIRHGAILEK